MNLVYFTSFLYGFQKAVLHMTFGAQTVPTIKQRNFIEKVIAVSVLFTIK